MRVLVLGGGISGLSAAHALVRHGAEVLVLESSGRAGGVLQTEHRDGFLIERAADMFSTAEPWALELCQELDFTDQLVGTNERGRGALVVHRGRLRRVPEGFTLMAARRLWPLCTTPILSWRAKLRLACEPFVRPRRSDTDESLADFARRRLGRETYERLVQPLVGGIYVADGEKLSLRATLPRFVQWERQYGSLWRGARQSAGQQHSGGQPAGGQPAGGRESGARYGLFVAPRQGMGSLVQRLVKRLPANAIRYHSRVCRIDRCGPRWQAQVEGRSEPETADGLVLATPAPVAAELLQPLASPLARELAAIEHASSAIVIQAFARSQLQAFPPAFGFVVPLVEKRQILAASFASAKFPGRAPQDELLVRTFVGGACQPELAELEDQPLLQLVRGELQSLLGIHGQPHWELIQRWPRSMPQYHLGHLDRVARIQRHLEQLPGVALAGNAYRGVGIPFCVRSGRLAADKVLADLAARTHGPTG